ncbi:hypothetical protein [Mycobacterium gastri]|uniref:Uncharacterized protein n=1 Tax=Mycobacterium gastri TaxID=1777 RepID=A0A1X1V8L5_MYCGS|nr:hypothetical protein [Mycobacterium gastri]ETW25867.1 hypothetical protein MGAST_00275 [Mycobacterium gastri 'Wayne']ORV65382.1 hypothetical protein AWC07_13645 [Mycobacterium gastri]
MTEIMIDPNVRVAGDLTFSGYEDVRGPLPIAGQQVLVREPEANLVAVGIVRRVDENDRLIYIAVDWARLAPDRIPTPDEFMGILRRNQVRSLFQPIDRPVVSGATLRSA